MFMSRGFVNIEKCHLSTFHKQIG